MYAGHTTQICELWLVLHKADFLISQHGPVEHSLVRSFSLIPHLWLKKVKLKIQFRASQFIELPNAETNDSIIWQLPTCAGGGISLSSLYTDLQRLFIIIIITIYYYVTGPAFSVFQNDLRGKSSVKMLEKVMILIHSSSRHREQWQQVKEQMFSALIRCTFEVPRSAGPTRTQKNGFQFLKNGHKSVNNHYRKVNIAENIPEIDEQIHFPPMDKVFLFGEL